MNLSHLIEQVVAEKASQVAFSFPAGDVDYKTFLEASRRFARALQKLGVEQGDRVALMLPNLPQFPIVYSAIMRIGAVVVPINMMYKGREVAWLLEDSEAKVLVGLAEYWEELSRYATVLNSLKHIVMLGETVPESTHSLTTLLARSQPLTDIADVNEDDPAVIQYTAGISGTSKGAELTYGNLISNLNACREIMRVVPKDRFLAMLPFFHPMGETLVMNLALSTGATLDLHHKFEPETVLEAIRSGKDSIFVGVPSMFKILLDQSSEDDLPVEKPLRLCICGGGSIDEDVLKQFEKRFNTYILETYTISETSPVTSFNQWRTGRRVGSLGHPIPGVEMRVIDEEGNETSIGEVGEIVIKGDNVMRGYINRPRLTEEVLRDGWFHTGDLGKMDINGFFYLVDRLSYRIVKGGFSIYPREVEEVLFGHPDIEEVAVVGIPDDVMGEEVKACVVLKPEATATTEQIGDYCRERMALYKVPAVVRFYKDLPRTSTGRINKTELQN